MELRPYLAYRMRFCNMHATSTQAGYLIDDPVKSLFVSSIKLFNLLDDCVVEQSLH